jgi:hypothetical protein
MPRILLLVADQDPSTAIAVTVASCGSSRVADALDPAAMEAALRGADWDVCVADTAFAANAMAARQGRGLVVLGTGLRRVTARRDRTRGEAAAHNLHIPCSVATLRDAVLSVAAGSAAPKVDAS